MRDIRETRHVVPSDSTLTLVAASQRSKPLGALALGVHHERIASSSLTSLGIFSEQYL